MGEHWQIILTTLLIPTCLAAFSIMIKRMLDKRDKSETEKDRIIHSLTEKCTQQTEDTNFGAHERIFKALSNVEFDIKSIDTSLKLINGSVRSTKAALDLHIVKGHGE